MQAYAALKGTLLKRTQRGGTFLTLYIFFVVSSPVSCLLPPQSEHHKRVIVQLSHCGSFFLSCLLDMPTVHKVDAEIPLLCVRKPEPHHASLPASVGALARDVCGSVSGGMCCFTATEQAGQPPDDCHENQLREFGNVQAALCTMIGAGASYLYLLLLMLDVDSRSAQDENLIMKAEEVWIRPARGHTAFCASPSPAL